MISQQDIRILLADGYYTFAKTAGMDMRRVTEILEALRPHFTDQPDYNVWKKIPFEAGDLENDDLIRMLVKLKFDYYTLICKNVIQTVQEEAKEHKDKAFITWLKFYAEAIIYWESLVYDRIDDADYDLFPEHLNYIKSAQKYHDFIRDNRWGDCYDRYNALAENEHLPALHRALIYCISAQIQIYFRLDMDKAMEHLETAKRLAPGPNSKIERCFGEWHLKKLDFDTARMYFMNAMSIDLSDTDAILAMGDSYRDEYKLDIAEDYYQKAIVKNPLDSSAYDRLIYLYGDPEKFDEKEALLHQMLHKIEVINLNMPDKKYSNWRYNGYRAMGYVYYANKKFDTAAEWYNKAIKLQPGWASALIDLGNTWFEAKDYESAKKQYEKALAVNSAHPQNAEVFSKLAAAYGNTGDHAESEKYYLKALEINPQANNNWNELGIISYRRKDFSTAAYYFEKAIEVYPDEPVYYTNLADAYQNNNEPDKLKAALEQGLQKFPENGDLYNRLGNYYYVLGDSEKALAAYQKAAEDLSTDPVVYSNLAGAYKVLGNWTEAGKNYREALRLSPENDTYMNEIGVAAFRSGDFNTAAEFFKKAAEQLPTNATYFDNLAQAYNELPGKKAEAEQAFLEAVRLSPDNDLTQNRLGNFYLLHQKYEEALAHYKIAAGLKPDHPVYAANEGNTQCYLGDFVAAIHNLEKAVALDPSITTIHNWLALAYALQGDPQKAADYLLDQMQKMDDPEFLATFLEIYAKVPDTSAEYARNALQIIQSQPNINLRYEAMITNGN